MHAFLRNRLCKRGFLAIFLFACLYPPKVLAQSKQIEALLERVNVQAIARGPDDGIYLAGYTYAPDLPGTEGALQGSLAVEQCSSNPDAYFGSCTDAFVAKLDGVNHELLFATYLGGMDFDDVLDIITDSQGNVYLLGVTSSEDFPTTPTAAQRTLADDVAPTAYVSDLFVAKISPVGDEMLYSTYLGGSKAESQGKIQVDSGGGIYVVAEALSPDFPVTAGAYQTTRPEPPSDVLLDFGWAVSTVTKLDPASEELVYSTYFDDLVADLAIDTRGAAVLAGPPQRLYFFTGTFPAKGLADLRGPFLSVLSPDGTSVESTMDLSGFGSVIADIELDGDGNTWITGGPASDDLPLTNPIPGLIAPQGFIAKLAPEGTVLFASHLPGAAERLMLSELGEVGLMGETYSANVPTTPDAFLSGPCGVEFVMRLGPSGELHYSSYSPPAYASIPSFVLPGELEVLTFHYRRLASFRETDEPPSFACVTHGATRELISFVDPGPFVPGVVEPEPALSPGAIVDLHGIGWGPEDAVPMEFDEQGRIATNLGGVRALFDGIPAPLLSVQERLIRAIVPFAQASDARMTIEIETANGDVHSRDAHWAIASPGVFTVDGTGAGQAAVLNEDGTLNSAANPARKGSVVAIFATGGGPTTVPSIDGAITSIEGALSSLFTPIAVTFGSYFLFFDPEPPPDAEILYAGAAPGLVGGVIQINARIPQEAPSGPRVRIHVRTSLVLGFFELATAAPPTIAIE